MTATDGVARTDLPHLWPTTIIRPRCPPLVVYLDLNHWIELANAHAGRTDRDTSAEVLAQIVEAARSDRAVFPLSDTIYIEVGKMANRQYRRELREVMEKISRYRVISSRLDIVTHEVETLLDDRVGPSHRPINTLPYLDRGVARAFGMVGGFRVHDADDERDVTAQVRASWRGGPEAFDQIVLSAEVGLNRSVLDGPATDEEETELEAVGYDRVGHMAVQQRRADQENELVALWNKDGQFRRGRIRDAISAREMTIELSDIITRGCMDRGVGTTPILQSRDDIRSACDSMPSTDVSVTLKASYHRDPNLLWTPNDIADIAALASSIPYCDIVVTDKRIADHANRTGLADRFGTLIAPRLAEIVDRIA